MAEERVKRKLSAILCADVVGYSRLMSEDEEGTLVALKTLRTDFIDPIIDEHRGRIVKLMGDGALIEFASVLEAFKCAVAVQRGMPERNAEVPEDRQIVFRMGINLGDIIIDGDDIYGNGVNVAARLEALAEPGGICISGRVFSHVEKNAEVGFASLGPQNVKNIDTPINAYKVLLDPKTAGTLIDAPRVKVRNRLRLVAAGIALIVTLAGVGYWYQQSRPEIEPALVEKMAFPLPDKPSIAVLPFENMSGEPEQEYFCDGLTEEIITALSKVPKLFVIARNSVFTYKDKPVKVNQVAEELGVRYVLEGSIRKSGDQIRITAQLIDAVSGHHLWAERYDRNLTEIFAIQDNLTKNIVTAMQVKLTEGEQVKAAAKGTNNLEAYLKFLQARDKTTQYNIESNALGKQLAKEAIALDPEYAMAYKALADTHQMDMWLGTSKSPKQSIAKCKELLEKAIELDANYANAHATLGWIFSIMGEHDRAVSTAEHAVAINPNAAHSHVMLGHTLRFAGRYEEAIPEYKKALRLNPIPPTNYFFGLGLAYSWTEQHEEAIKWCEKAVRKDPDSFLTHLMMAQVYARAGRLEEARVQAAEVLRINPKFSIEKFLAGNKAKHKHEYAEAMRKAGLPEKPQLKLPDKPSIAVLPFDNMSDDPNQEYFSDGISEDIITALSKTPQMFVIARNSTFTYKGKAVEIDQIAEELGVQYVLKGSVRREADRVRITAQLIDAFTGHHLWAEKYDRQLDEIFSLQDEITKSIITSLQVELTEGEQAKVYAKGTDNLEAYLKAMKAHFLYLNGSRDGLLKALDLAQEAIDLDPNYAFAYKVLGGAKGITLWRGLSKNPKETLNHTIELHQRSVELDDTLAIAHAGLGYWIMYTRQHDKAVAEGEQAFMLEPGSADVVHLYATILAYAGRREESIPLFEEALRLNPKPPNSYLRHYSLALRDTGRYQEGIALMERAVRNEPDDVIAWVQIACLSHLSGREEEAQAAVQEVLRINPNFSVARIERVTPHRDRAFAKQFGDCMRNAGLPE